MAVLLGLLLLLTGIAQAQVPFQLDNPKQKFFPEAYAERLYFASCEAVRRDLDLKRAPRPVITVKLGAKDDAVFTKDGKSELRLKKWEPRLFSQGVIVAATAQIVPPDKVAELSNRVLQTTMIDPEALRGEK